MSWHFSRALVVEYSEGTCSDGEQSVPSSKTTSPQLYSQCDKMMEFCRRSPSGMTCEPLTESRGEELLTWFLAAFPARTFQSTEVVRESLGNEVVSGARCRGLFARYNPDSCLWRTHQLSLYEDSEASSVIWPKWGSMRNGVAYQRQSAVRPTSEIESGSWDTPTASDWKGSSSGCKFGQRAAQFQKLTEGKYEDGSIYPNPMAFEALMGWPIMWTELKPLATDKFPCAQQQHFNYSLKGLDNE